VSDTATGYVLWAIRSGLSGADAGFTSDVNGDRIANGMAFLLGAADAQADATPLLPTGAMDGAYLVFRFRRADSASYLDTTVDYGMDLVSWAPAVDGVDGVEIREIDDGYAPGIDRVDVRFPSALAVYGSLFARLVVQGS
jgi:hypothetical protein